MTVNGVEELLHSPQSVGHSTHLGSDDDDVSNYAASSSSKSPRPPSPTPSEVPSVYSYDSTADNEIMLKTLHGRTINNTSEYYMLPADAPEHSRLDVQHEMLKKRMNGIFLKPDAVRRAMAPRQSEPPAALDIGTGSGSWVVDMARLFPHAEIVGVDLVPANLSSSAPGNCRFECDDVNLGLAHYKNCFDVVNIRCISTGITDFRRLVDEVAEVLRPGGVFLSVEGDMELFDENFRPIRAEKESDPGFCWMAKTMSAACEAMLSRNSDYRQNLQLPDWLKDMDCWEEIGSKNYYIPIGPWEENMSDKDRYISELMRQDAMRLSTAVRPLLISHGYFAQTVDSWAAKVKDELSNMKIRTYVKWHCAWAVKKRRPAASVYSY